MGFASWDEATAWAHATGVAVREADLGDDGHGWGVCVVRELHPARSATKAAQASILETYDATFRKLADS
jgi:hypothetical protein